MPHEPYFVEHRGRRIAVFDYADTPTEAQALARVDAAQRFVARQPRRQDLLTLSDFSGSIYTSAVVNRLKTLLTHNKPWVLAAAVIGLSGARRLIVRLMSVTSGRKLAVFRTRAEALDWLARQTEPPRSVPEEFAEEDGIHVPDFGT